MSRSIAERKDGGVGGVMACGSCDEVHLRWDGVTLTLPRERFLELARLVSEAASSLGKTPARERGAGRGAAWMH